MRATWSNVVDHVEDREEPRLRVNEPQPGGVDVTDASSSSASDAALVAGKPRRSWRSYVWDTFDKSPEERKFLYKLDTVVLTLASLGYFIKYLDQININNAFVSGMKRDLQLYGEQLNDMQTCWTVGYVLGEIPRYGFVVTALGRQGLIDLQQHDPHQSTACDLDSRV